MIDKRLVGMMGNSKKYIVFNVLFQWLSLCANIVMMVVIANLIQDLYYGTADAGSLVVPLVVAVIVLAFRYFCTTQATRMSHLSSRAVKRTFRKLIYEKMLRLGASYDEQVTTSEIVQVSVEGVDQLELYFGQYLPQFFYSMIAPFTLFLVLGFTVNWFSALMLFLCVPLIPMTIAMIQTWAKKLLSKYWDVYTGLGDSFLENLQGLTTLKIYQADQMKSEEMDVEAEHFRKITMKVLTMQLNSVTIMDTITYGGTALGAILAVLKFRSEKVELAGALLIILLAAEYFLPMRRLGSYFHVSMNGQAASDKIFNLLALPEPEQGTLVAGDDTAVDMKDVTFSYEEDREVLHGISLEIPNGSLTAIVGESGCGKSTVAALLMGRNRGYGGTVTLGGQDLSQITEESLMKTATYIGSNSYLFKGSVRDNLLMGNPDATDDQLWAVLDQVSMKDFLESENGLDTQLSERAANLSGGQCQRLALARALLHDSNLYIFDEATSNIDVESENSIMEQVHRMKGQKTIVLISHRLANVTDADNIYVMDAGNVVEHGTHAALKDAGGTYAELWNTQSALENFGKEAVQA